MSLKFRKFVGLTALLLFLITYIAVAVMLVPAATSTEGKVLEIIYYAVAGMIWIFPARFIIRWIEQG